MNSPATAERMARLIARRWRCEYWQSRRWRGAATAAPPPSGGATAAPPPSGDGRGHMAPPPKGARIVIIGVLLIFFAPSPQPCAIPAALRHPRLGGGVYFKSCARESGGAARVGVGPKPWSSGGARRRSVVRAQQSRRRAQVAAEGGGFSSFGVL